MKDSGSDDEEAEQEESDGVQTSGFDEAVSMTDLPVIDGVPGMGSMHQAFRPVLLQMVEPIVDQVRESVPAFYGARGGRRHQLMSIAATSAIESYLDTSDDRLSAQRKVDELFHRMGWGEGQAGHGVEPLDAALTVAARAAWDYLSDFAVARGLPAGALRDVTRALFDYTDHLRAELIAGHALGLHNPVRAREELWAYFRGSSAGRTSPRGPLGVDPDELRRRAAEAHWPLPHRVVALVVSYHGDPPALDAPEILTSAEPHRLLVLCPEVMAGELTAELARSGPDRRVVVSWPVPPEESGTALLWATRALDLVQLNVIPPTPVVRCNDHTTQLWLHSEPALRRRLCQDLLEPLLAESHNSREILSETLLTWLETRDSAPVIAARLDIHPQTVRYRWRRINELFGESLRDPEFAVQMTLVLKASVPMWRGGDQSDFDLFRDTKGSGR